MVTKLYVELMWRKFPDISLVVYGKWRKYMNQGNSKDISYFHGPVDSDKKASGYGLEDTDLILGSECVRFSSHHRDQTSSEIH